jgi:hypothetical protein
MEVVEQTALPYPQAAVPAQQLETSTSAANLQVSKMAYFRVLIRKQVTTEVCPSLSQPKFYVTWRSGSAKAGRPSSFSHGISGSPTFPVHHRLLQITLQYSQ